jgi:hypothetical protein
MFPKKFNSMMRAMVSKKILVFLVVIAVVADVGGYVLLSREAPDEDQSLVSLESVSVIEDSKIKSTWEVHNPSDSTVGLVALIVHVEGNYAIPAGSDWIGVETDIDGWFECTDIGPGKTVLVVQNYEVFKIIEVSPGVTKYDHYPKTELEKVTDWVSGGGLAQFTSGGCGTGGEELCAEIEGRTTNDCGNIPRLRASQSSGGIPGFSLVSMSMGLIAFSLLYYIRKQ